MLTAHVSDAQLYRTYMLALAYWPNDQLGDAGRSLNPRALMRLIAL